jgi:two-component system LytT family response regulator
MILRALLVDDEPLARDRLRALLGDETDLEIVGESGDGPSAVAAIRKLKPDMVFLDIHMPGMDGFEVLETLEPEHWPWTIFVTAYDQHAVRAFQARALDYLLKPASKARVKEAVARVREHLAAAKPSPQLQQWLAEREDSRRLAVRNGSRVIFVPVANIDWIEAAGNYALIHAGKETHILRETLGDLERRLPHDAFLRVSRGAIVNLGRIRELHHPAMGHWEAVLQDDQRVPVTRARAEIERRLS